MPQKPKPLTPYRSARDQFGAELRERRIQHGLSQAALAKTVHVHPDLIAKVEKAVRRPSRTLAAACDEALGSGGLLTALWPATVAQRRGPHEASGALLSPIGRVAAAYGGCDASRNENGDRAAADAVTGPERAAALIRLDPRRYEAADLAGLDRAAGVEVVWYAAGAAVPMTGPVPVSGSLPVPLPVSGSFTVPGLASVSRSFLVSGPAPGAVGTTAPGIFALPPAQRPARLTFTRCALLAVEGTDLRVRGLAAPAGAAVFDLWPCAVDEG